MSLRCFAGGWRARSGRPRSIAMSPGPGQCRLASVHGSATTRAAFRVDFVGSIVTRGY